ncbi:ROK family protein [Candidatus Nitrosotenuis cloacae]|uniref:ROK family protein n=1 Tax=Candidatus Nitrosotenuis cloacae TaxID=1603555 RepID=UPI00227F4FF0|nr:ROK family protein [Candidatus Nitrosotenuis cloacae]
MYKIGIDLGGTKIEGICLDEKLNAVKRTRIPTNQHNGYRFIVDSIVSLVRDLTKEISDYSIGICTPGAISKKTGLIKNSNTQCLIGMPLKDDLERLLGRKIAMDNDANCFAMAESRLGAAVGHGVVFGVIMGTGVGGGIVIDGKVHRGRTNIAGEWGHHTLHQNGNKCYCGKLGCVETYISGPALEKRWTQLTGKKSGLPEIVKALDGVPAQTWKKEFLENFGTGLANVIDILDPDAVVLGGGLSNIDFLYTEGRDAVYGTVFSDLVDTPILKNKLGDSAGVFGAALL